MFHLAQVFQDWERQTRGGSAVQLSELDFLTAVQALPAAAAEGSESQPNCTIGCLQVEGRCSSWVWVAARQHHRPADPGDSDHWLGTQLTAGWLFLNFQIVVIGIICNYKPPQVPTLTPIMALFLHFDEQWFLTPSQLSYFFLEYTNTCVLRLLSYCTG